MHDQVANSADAPGLWRGVARLVAEIRRVAISADPIGTRPMIADRQTYRVSLDDGSIVKVRVLLTDEHAREWGVLRSHLGSRPWLAACLAQHGRLVLEEWVDGAALPERSSDERMLRAAGRVLRQMHLTSVKDVSPSDSTPLATSVQRAPHFLEMALTTLTTSTAITSRSAQLIARRAAQLAPPDAVTGLVHYDFCGPNIVQHAGRGLVSIDHEWLHIGVQELDLARTIRRWHLDQANRAVLLDGYKEESAEDVSSLLDRLDYWLLHVDVTAAARRVENDWPDASDTVQQLRSWEC